MSVDIVNNSLISLGAVFDETQDTTSTKKEDPLGRDVFLKMLVAQMENQDPLNPMEGADFSAQLAQFSQLEQLFNLNDTLEGLAASMESKGQENILDYIGKQITSEDNSLNLKDGKVSNGLFTLTEPSEAMITIYDYINQEIMTLYPGELQAGTHQVDWDGRDRTGVSVSDGTYKFQVTAVTESGAHVPVKTEATGLVTGVTYDSGHPYLVVDDRWVDPATVTKIWDPSVSSGS
ncbi:MAG TPA: flagellar hook assembly protein FlgD [Deltaproteobacteria bacterium]|nr:flagellar hook assembly protein FlgD [Deltaproteobacteria bacterium]